jgi:hypothetical protein
MPVSSVTAHPSHLEKSDMPWIRSNPHVRQALGIGLCLILAVSLLWQQRADAATLAFSDNFEDGNANGWTSPRGQWQVCQQPGRSLAFCVTRPTAPIQSASPAASAGPTTALRPPCT